MKSIDKVKRLVVIILIIGVLINTNMYIVKAEEGEEQAKTETSEENIEQNGNKEEDSQENENNNEVENPPEGENQGEEGQGEINGEELDLGSLLEEQGIVEEGAETEEEQEEEEPKDVLERTELTLKINKDGSGTVTEVWTADMQVSKELCKPYKNLGDCEIKNLSITDEREVQYTYVENWNKDADQDAKIDKCGIYTDGEMTNICWGFGEYGSHKYIIRYDITNIVRDYEDYQLIYFTMYPETMTPTPQKAKVILYSDDFEFNEDNVEISGYGYLGKSEIENGWGIFETMSSLETMEYMQIYARFEGTPFEGKPGMTFTVEDIMNFKEAEPAKEEEEHSGSTMKTVLICLGVLVGVAVITVIVILIIKKRRKVLRRRKAKEQKEQSKKE